METLQEKKEDLEADGVSATETSEKCGSVSVPCTEVTIEEQELWLEFLDLLKKRAAPAMDEPPRAIFQIPLFDKIPRKKRSNIRRCKRRYNLLQMEMEEQKVGLQSVSSFHNPIKTKPCDANTCHKRKLFNVVTVDGGEKAGKKQKKQMRNIFQPNPELQHSFRTFIEQLGGINPILVVEKKLYKSDIDPVQGRFLMPPMQMNGDFLTAEESRVLEMYQKNKYRGEYDMKVSIIEPSMERSRVSLRVWDVQSKPTHVLMKGWNSIVERNKLRVGQIVQLWAFRIGPQLCFAMPIVG